MDDQPKRKPWQIHLSTAILIMLVCGIVISVGLRLFNKDTEPKYLLVLFMITETLCVLILFAAFIEWLIRRRDAPRKPHALSRRWFQLHLSTLIALSFATGGLMWLNLRNRGNPHPKDHGIFTDYEFVYGAPFDAVIGRKHGPLYVELSDLILNILAAIVLLSCIAFVCERLIRRHEARRKPPA